MEENQEIKQSYLRKEILEKNYDANLFLEFLITKKGEIASDINNWTIEELKVVVSEFKKIKNDDEIEISEKQKNDESETNDENIDDKEEKDNKINEKSNPENKYNSFNTFL